MRANELYYWEGEKPAPLPWRYEDEDGNLIPLTGTMKALTSIDGAADVEVAVTNNGDGTGTIDWPTAAGSVFVLAGDTDGVMRVDLELTNGDEVWYPVPRFSFPVRKRT